MRTSRFTLSVALHTSLAHIQHQLVSELHSSDSEDPDDSEDDAQSDSSEMSDFIKQIYEVLCVQDNDVECVTVQSK